MNQEIRQKVMQLAQNRANLGFEGADEGQSPESNIEEISFLVHEEDLSGSPSSDPSSEACGSDFKMKLLRSDFIEAKDKIETILVKFKSKNPAVMKLLGQISNTLNDFLNKLN